MAKLLMLYAEGLYRFLGNTEDNDLEDVLGKVWRCPHAVDVHVLQHRPQHRPAERNMITIKRQRVFLGYV